MSFYFRTFSYAKDPEHPEQNQDVCRVMPEKGVAVIADGVSSAIFSAAWAKILTESVVNRLPVPEDAEVFKRWLCDRRKEWENGIDTANLAWYQKPKLATGAFSTLLWVKIEPCAFPGDDWSGDKMALDPSKECYWLSGYAIGDSCLFHVRPGYSATGVYEGTDLLYTFPVEKSEDFEASPTVLGSKDLGRDEMITFQPLGILAQEGDYIILATDAISLWALKYYESGNSLAWDELMQMSDAHWQAMIDQARESGEMRYDDTTFIIIHLEKSSDKNDSVFSTFDAQNLDEDPISGEQDKFSEDENAVFLEDDVNFHSAEDEYQAEWQQENFTESQSVVSEIPSCEISENEFGVSESDSFSDENREKKDEPNVQFSGRYHDEHVSYPEISPMDEKGEMETKKNAQKPASGFHYSLASGRKPSEGEKGGAQSWRQRENSSAKESQNGEVSHRVAEQLDVLRQRGMKMAENVGDRVSDGINTVGEVAHRAVEAGKPRIQKIVHGVMGFFKKDKPETEESDEQKLQRQAEEDAQMKRQARKNDPNRRKFYNPKNIENKKDERG
ncbi:MAG: hypothetical protein Q4C96_04880 [Planctomycetia bacterium]|nr:hypothetical protein [Planctomycetia bacterium]